MLHSKLQVSANAWKLAYKLLIMFLVLVDVSANIQWKVRINALEGLSYMFDFSTLMLSNADANTTLQIWAQTNHLIYSKTMEQMLELSQNSSEFQKYVEIWNYQSVSIDIEVKIINSDFQFPSDPYELQLLKQSIIVRNQAIKRQKLQMAMIFKDDVSSIILPFNLLSQKKIKVFVQENRQKLEYKQFENQPFLNTYWNQIESDQLLISWLPYFSQCKYKTSSRIFLNDIIQMQQNGKSCKQDHSLISLISGDFLSCQTKIIETECMIEELNIKENKKLKQYWYQNSYIAPYYFLNEFYNRQDYLDHKYEDIEEIADIYYKTMVPLKYKIQFDDDEQEPNLFQFSFKVINPQNSSSYRLFQVTLVGYYQAQLQQELSKNQVKLKISTMYITNFQYFQALESDFLWYIIHFLSIVLAIIVLIKKILAYKKIHLNWKVIKKVLIYPLFKGYQISLSISFPYVGILLLIVKYHEFSFIGSDFDDSEVQINKKFVCGRIGLTLLISGLFLLKAALKQSYKVLTPEQAVFIIEEESLSKSKNNTQSICQDSSKDEKIPYIEKADFMTKNMKTYRSYIYFSFICFIFALIYIYYLFTKRRFIQIFTLMLIAQPVIQRIIIVVFRHYILKEMIYLMPILITFHAYYFMFLIKNNTITQCFLMELVKIISQYPISLLIDYISEKLCLKYYHQFRLGKTQHLKTQSKVQKFYEEEEQLQPINRQMKIKKKIVSFFKQSIIHIAQQSQYERSIYYACFFQIKISAYLAQPFIICLILVTIKQNLICKETEITYTELTNNFAFILCVIPLQIFIALCGIKLYDTVFGLSIKKCLQFNSYNFKNRKTKWISDSFFQNPCIQQFYRQFQKLLFSSQLYIYLFLVVNSLSVVQLSIKIILQAKYNPTSDPACLIILIIVWGGGYCLSMVCSFISIKCKFYAIKHDELSGGKLKFVQNIMKAQICERYINLPSVQSYFLLKFKDKIVNNLQRILSQQDFTQNNHLIVNKYYKYKSLLMRHRNQELKKSDNNQIILRQIKKLGKEQSTKRLVITLNKQDLIRYGRPLIYQWLYMAKQLVFLKKLTENLKKKYKKQKCQFCSMMLDLQVQERVQYAEIVNQFRLMNVGCHFSAPYFLQFYRSKQQYITLCQNCLKDNFKKNKGKYLKFNASQKGLLKKWLMGARSRLLHSANH